MEEKIKNKNNFKKQLRSPKRTSANGTLDPCKTPPCCYLKIIIPITISSCHQDVFNPKESIDGPTKHFRSSFCRLNVVFVIVVVVAFLLVKGRGNVNKMEIDNPKPVGELRRKREISSD